jgi:hypothetical protein
MRLCINSIDSCAVKIRSERMKNFIAPADRLLTADQLAAKLARSAPARARRAELRAAIATAMGLGGSQPAVIREANRRLRAQAARGW